MDDVGAVAHRAEVVHAEACVDLAGQLQPAEAVVEHFPLVRLAQAQRIGGEEDGGGNAARPVLGEGVHRLQLAAAQGVEELELAHQLVGAERLEGELARGLLDDAAAPRPEGLEADAARPGGLHLPGGADRAAGHRGRRRAAESPGEAGRSEEHTSELQSLMRSSYAVFCLKKKTIHHPRKDSNRPSSTLTTTSRTLYLPNICTTAARTHTS